MSFGLPNLFSFRAARKAIGAIACLFLTLATISGVVNAQKRPARKAQAEQARTTDQLAKLREDYVRATKDYKASLEKLIAFYEADERKAERRLTQTRELFAQGLVAKKEVEASEAALNSAKEKTAGVRQQIATADTQIANAFVETQADKQMANLRTPRGGLIRTTSFIRYNGPGPWALSDSWKIQNFFREKFGRALPIAVFGQGGIHDRWRLDHHNAMDVDLNPDGVEGQALINFLRNNGIPFSAFRSAIPFTATGPHIHVGWPSHRY